MDTHNEEMTKALPNKLCSGNYKATGEEDDQGIPGEEIWSQKWGQQDSSTAGGRWRRRLKTELDEGKSQVCGMHSTGSDKAEDKEVKSSSLHKSPGCVLFLTRKKNV